MSRIFYAKILKFVQVSEGIASIDLAACAVVNVKVGRVGGLAATTRIHDLCVARGVPMWCGGMLETGIGRAHNIHVATMPGFVYPGDTASASRTYARDVTEQELEATDGIMPVPPGAGIGVSLNFLNGGAKNGTGIDGSSFSAAAGWPLSWPAIDSLPCPALSAAAA